MPYYKAYWHCLCPSVQRWKFLTFSVDLLSWFYLACSDTFLNDMVIYDSYAVCSEPLKWHSLLLLQDHFLIHAVSSAQGKYKAFSTCAYHLSVVFLFYSTLLGVFLSSSVHQNSHLSATASVMYTVVTPMLNPFIYSLRNKEIKRALKTLFERLTMKDLIILDLKKCY
jgi:olfactory receptor